MGAFEALEPLGAGGMGVVWRGVHRRSGLRVAIKLLSPGRASDEASLTAFWDEVRAVAGLSHPHIVPPLDRGVVDAAAAERSGGRWAEGAPWMAMELAAGGSLQDRRDRLDWPASRRILLDLLSALGHAHAAGVLHRDIKPANLLFGRGEDPDVLRLADFGIARVGGGAAPGGTVRGTPAFMAPEQFLGRPWLEGPWTDLYAAGCLAVWLVTGRVPFPTKDFLAAGIAHRQARPPALAPRFPVPPGLGGWILRLMAKAPRDRPAFAADAAHALRALGDSTPGVAAEVAGEDFPTETIDATPGPRVPVGVRLPNPGAAAPFPPAAAALGASDAPGDGRDPLRDAGLGLFGMRPVPFVGRAPEMAALGAALASVRTERRARAVVVSGPSGTGKSRLTERFARVARESGAAEALTARHAASPGPGDGLFAMLARHWRCLGGGREELAERLRVELPSDAAAAERASLEVLITGDGAELPPALRTRDARWALLRRRLAAVARDRPAIVVVDDAQWGVPAVEFVRAAIADPESPTVLYVVVVQDEALARAEASVRALERLRASARCGALPLDPLGDAESEDLVRAILGLDVPLVRRLTDRTSGNPLFAVQLVADWVGRGVLEPGEGGLRLADAADTALPPDLRTLWSSYLEGVGGDGDARALELAAVLGVDVDPAEWAAACARADAEPAPGLLERLVGRRLARVDPGGRGWSFVHGMLREALVQEAVDGGRARDHHRVCAEVLEGRAAPHRVGRHLAGAGRWADAIGLLLEGAIALRIAGDAAAACSILDDLDDALDHAGAPPADPRRAEGIRVRGEALWTLGLLPEFRKVVARAEAHARLPGSTLRPAVHLWRGYELEREGMARESIEEFRAGERTATEDGNSNIRQFAREALAAAYMNLGETASADAVLAASLRDMDPDEDVVAYCNAVNLRGLVGIRDGRLEAAQEFIEESLALAERHGIPQNVGLNRMNLGEIARMRGDLDAAEAHYRAAADILGRSGRNAIYPTLNLGLVQLERGRLDEAWAALEGVAEAFARRELPAKEGVVRLLTLRCAARREDWRGWDEQYALARRLLRGRSEFHAEVAESLEDAGALAAAAGHSARARDVRVMARDQWKAVGRADDADRVAALLRDDPA